MPIIWAQYNKKTGKWLALLLYSKTSYLPQILFGCVYCSFPNHAHHLTSCFFKDRFDRVLNARVFVLLPPPFGSVNSTDLSHSWNCNSRLGESCCLPEFLSYLSRLLKRQLLFVPISIWQFLPFLWMAASDWFVPRSRLSPSSAAVAPSSAKVLGHWFILQTAEINSSNYIDCLFCRPVDWFNSNCIPQLSINTEQLFYWTAWLAQSHRIASSSVASAPAAQRTIWCNLWTPSVSDRSSVQMDCRLA